MSNIESFSQLDRSKLNGEFYFTSLLEQAYSLGVLDGSDMQRLQIGCLELLAIKTAQYTDNMSSSVRVEVAEALMESNLYTVGLYLKSLPTPDEAVKRLTSAPIRELYNAGRKIIDLKLRTARSYQAAVLHSMLKTENLAYNSTLIGGIKGFFKLYNPDFLAQEIHITADYPLCNSVENLTGIEFIQKYLESLKYENEFCRCFSPAAIENVLRRYHKNYQPLVFNIFLEVLTSALGCVLAESDPVSLSISASQLLHLNQNLVGKSKQTLEALTRTAVEVLFEELSITGKPLQAYIKAAVPKASFNIFHAVKVAGIPTLQKPL